ncbi:hypothetical protein KCU90_g115, partial [Aureobasidium melanogenum]
LQHLTSYRDAAYDTRKIEPMARLKSPQQDSIFRSKRKQEDNSSNLTNIHNTNLHFSSVFVPICLRLISCPRPCALKSLPSRLKVFVTILSTGAPSPRRCLRTFTSGKICTLTTSLTLLPVERSAK